MYSVLGVCILSFLALVRIMSPVDHLGKYSGMKVVAFGPVILLILSFIAFIFQGEVDTGRVLGFVIIAAAAASYAALAGTIDPVDVVTKLLIFHFTIFYIQFILYFAFGVDFDPVGLLSDVTQSGWGGSLEHEALGSFRRLGGMYNEPGTYATFIAPLVAILLASGGSGRRHQMTLLGAIVSLALTFSIFAWAFITLLIFVMLLGHFRKFVLLLPLLPVIVWLAIPYVEYRFIDSRAAGVDVGFSFRQEILQSIMIYTGESLNNFLFGVGLFSSDVPFFFWGAINDVGLVPYSFFASGVLGLCVIGFLVYRSVLFSGMAGVALATILLLSKISVMAPMFWIILMLSVHVGIERNKAKAIRDGVG